MKTSDYIVYDYIHRTTTGSGSSGSSSGCVTFLGIIRIVILALAGLATVTFSEVIALLIIIFVPFISLSLYEKFKKIKYRNCEDKEKTIVSKKESIVISVVSIILFLAFLIGIPNIKGAVVSAKMHILAPKILQEYGIYDYDIDVNTYNGGINHYDNVVYITVPQKTINAMSTYNELDLLDKLVSIPSDPYCNICLVVGENVHYISYRYGRHLEIKTYEFYHGMRYYAYSYWR